MADKRDGKILVDENDFRAKLLEGAEATYKAVGTTFGPKGANALIEKPFGRALLTRDGVTVAREVYFSDRAKNLGSQSLLDASEITNRLAGDGTSATTILAYYLFKNGLQSISAGVHPMAIKQMYLDDSYKLLDKLAELSKPVKKGQLKQVATVSSGDEILGTMISAAIEKVGVDGGIITEKTPITDIQLEFVDGYYLQAGFIALQAGKKEFIDPWVIVSIKRQTTAADVMELLNKTATAKNLQANTVPKIVFIGNFETAAYNCIVSNINSSTIDAIIIKTPPQYGEMSKEVLRDIAVYCQCYPIDESMNMKFFTKDYIGTVDKTVASKSEATLFSKAETEEIGVRIIEIKDQIKAEVVDAILERLKDRVAKLEGKVALFKIGAATETAKEEVEFRVEDGIRATRAAAQYGVVPGGGVTWLELSKLDISTYYRDALRSTFTKLLTNAGLQDQLLLQYVLDSSFGNGYDLKKPEHGMLNMIHEGILDPTLVVKQVIINATETIGNLLTVGIGVIREEVE